MSNLPTAYVWNSITGKYPWYPSHGSPTVSPNKIFLWAKYYAGKKRGEGMNLRYTFWRGRKYCVDTLFTFTS